LPEILAAIAEGEPADMPALLAAIAARLAETRATPAPVDESPRDELLTVAEAAAILRHDPKWIHRHRDLPFVRKVGNSLRISKRALDKWLARQRPG
jgi:hypothetical protein